MSITYHYIRFFIVAVKRDTIFVQSSQTVCRSKQIMNRNNPTCRTQKLHKQVGKLTIQRTNCGITVVIRANIGRSRRLFFQSAKQTTISVVGINANKESGVYKKNEYCGCDQSVCVRFSIFSPEIRPRMQNRIRDVTHAASRRIGAFGVASFKSRRFVKVIKRKQNSTRYFGQKIQV